MLLFSDKYCQRHYMHLYAVKHIYLCVYIYIYVCVYTLFIFLISTQIIAYFIQKHPTSSILLFLLTLIS